ncbi:MAG: glycosyltransferase family 2 protein, partial [Solirubrobacterales bacterium]
GGYDGDVIFENLELMRTIRASGGRVLNPLDLYVARRPPSAEHFLSQRVRQAYDDFAIPPRMAVWLTVLPALGAAAMRRRPLEPAVATAATIALAELGRRRAGGRRYFPASASALAPLWVLERAVCSWLALRERIARGGIPYGGAVVPRAASSMRDLRRRFARRDASRGGQGDGLPTGSPEADQLVGAVAERLPARRAAAA